MRLLFLLCLLPSFMLPGAAFAAGLDRDTLEGSLHMTLRGSGAAPFGLASAIVGGTGLAWNFARLIQGHTDFEEPIRADEHYAATMDFTLERDSRRRWSLASLAIDYEFHDRTRIDGDPGVIDRLDDAGRVSWSGGAWSGPAGWTPELEPEVSLLTWNAAKAADCANGAPGWFSRLTSLLAAEGEVGCFELRVRAAHPMRPTGTSVLKLEPVAEIRLEARDGITEITLETFELPENPLNSSHPSVQLFRKMAPDLVGSAVQLYEWTRALGLPEPRGDDEGILPEVTLDRGPDMTWDRTIRGAIRQNTILVRDVYTILTGAEAREELRIGQGPLVDIYREGRRITLDEVEARAGEKIELDGVVELSSSRPSEHRWTVGGPAIQDWVVTSAGARIDPIEDSETQDESISFAWWDEGSRKVTYTAVIDGRRHTAEATFLIEKPLIRVDASTPPGEAGVLEVSDGGSGSRKEIVRVGNEGYTIQFTHAPLPAKYAGSTQYVQLVASDGEWNKQKRVALKPWCLALESDRQLDGEYPYPMVAPRTARDTPGAPVSRYDESIRVDHRFEMHLLYRPDTPDAIWVPIRVVRWNWHGEAAWDPARSEHVGSVSMTLDPPDEAAAAYPLWRSVATKTSGWREIPCGDGS